MSGPEVDNDDYAGGHPSMERLLRYERHLEGEAFTQKVMAQAATRRRQRSWVLAGASLASVLGVVTLAPGAFTRVSDHPVPWHLLGAGVALPSMGVLLAVSLMCVFVFGVSRTVDGI